MYWFNGVNVTPLPPMWSDTTTAFRAGDRTVGLLQAGSAR